MNKLRSVAAFVIGLSAGVAWPTSATAAENDQLRGPDSLEPFVDEALLACPAAGELVYIGGANSGAEEALRLSKQEIAPLTRLLQRARTCRGPSPTESENHVLALMPSIVLGPAAECPGESLAYEPTHCFPVTDRNATPGVDCGPDCSTNDAGTPGDPSDDFFEYCLADERDVLRLLFAGLQHSGSTLADRRCDGDVRRSLVAAWDALFESGCSDGECAAARHLLLDTNYSVTALALVDRLGLPGPSTFTPDQSYFCSNTGRQARDPIRVPCDPADTVCEKDGTSDFLLPVSIPRPNSLLEDYEAYPAMCSTGKFALKPALKVNLEGGAFVYHCPEKANFSVAGFCLAPYRQEATAPVQNFNCTNTRTNNNVFSAGQDGRVFNKWLRTPSGALVSDWAGPQLSAFYRSRTSACTELDSEAQVACLTGQLACSLGIGVGRVEAPLGVEPRAMGGIAPTDENVRKFADGEPDAYPLTGGVYLATLIGLDAVSDPLESALAQCLVDPAVLAPATLAGDLIPLDTAPACVDFDETSCNGLAFACDTNVDCGSVGDCVGGNPATPFPLEGTCDQSCTVDADCAWQDGRTCIDGRCDFAVNSDACGCPAGWYLDAEEGCVPCPDGTFSTVPETTACTPWSVPEEPWLASLVTPGTWVSDATYEPRDKFRFATEPGLTWYTDVATDAGGNVYVVGSRNADLSSGTSTTDGLLRKFDASGNVVWSRFFGASDAFDIANGVAVDALGRIHVVGSTAGSFVGASQGEDDGFITVYDTFGDVLWQHQFGTTAFETIRGVALESDGTGYVIGDNGDALLVKYQIANVIWTQTFGTPETEEGWAVATDAAGGVLLAGRTEGALDGPNGGEGDVFVRKLADDGSLLWGFQDGEAEDSTAHGVDVGVDGSIYVVSSERDELDARSSLLRALSGSGEPTWGSPIEGVHAWDVSVEADGVYVSANNVGYRYDTLTSLARFGFDGTYHATTTIDLAFVLAARFAVQGGSKFFLVSPQGLQAYVVLLPKP